MAKVSMRVDYTLSQHSLTDQIRLAAEAGVDGVETGELMGYDCKLAGATAANNGLKFVACGFYDIWNARIGAPYEEIKGNLEKTISCAKDLGTNLLLSLTVDTQNRGAAANASFVENMKPVAEMCVKHDMILALEPHSTKYVNPLVDMSRYFLDKSSLAYALMDEIRCPNLKLLFDVYHCQTMEGDIFMNLKEHMDEIVHFHLAGVPGRDEPTNGEINYKNLVRYTQELGYKGYYGLEYFPTNPDDLARLAQVVSYIKEA